MMLPQQKHCLITLKYPKPTYGLILLRRTYSSGKHTFGRGYHDEETSFLLKLRVYFTNLL